MVRKMSKKIEKEEFKKVIENKGKETRKKTQQPGVFYLPVVFRDRLRLFKPGLAEKLRVLHCQR